MFINAEQGECIIEEFYPTDGNYMIYGVAESWTVTMNCEHAFDETYGVRLTLPDDWYVIETSNCEVTGQSSTYDCESSNDDGTITITNFFEEATEEKESFTFTVGSIRNPSVMEMEYSIGFEVISESGGVVDLGSYTFDDNLVVKGEIWKFTVTPLEFGVGQFPVFYKF